jgi:hypothetical protein
MVCERQTDKSPKFKYRVQDMDKLWTKLKGPYQSRTWCWDIEIEDDDLEEDGIWG